MSCRICNPGIGPEDALCSDCREMLERYEDFILEGYSHYKARILAGLADPDEESE